MKLALLSAILIALVSALPAQSEQHEAEVASEHVPVEEVVASAAAEEVAGVIDQAEEVPAFLDAVDAKGRGPCVRRYASSSSDSSCGCCDQCRKVYYDWMDFYTSVPNFTLNTGTWTYFNLSLPESPPFFTADDGILTTGCAGGVLDSKVYTSFQDGLGLNPVEDHAKYWAYAKTPIPIPPHGDAVVKWGASVQTFKTEENPFPSAIVERNDFRLANAQFMAWDPDTALYFAFLVTNHRVYIVYQQDPLLTVLPTKNAHQGITPPSIFTFVIPVKIRRTCDWHDMEIVFHGDSKEVSYHLDGQEVYVINQVGYYLDREYMVMDQGGVEIKSWPESVFYGFGTFSAVDNYPACQRTESCRSCRYPFIREGLVALSNNVASPNYNPIFGPPTLAVYWDNLSETSNKIWGQGTVAKIRKLIAYQRLPVC